jgi:O-antigen ligase
MALMVMFLGLTAIGFSRAAWMVALWVFALGSIWMGRKTFWVAGSLVALLMLTVPVVGERVVPGGTENLTDPDRLALVTTGRSELWAELWERGIEALPFGRGWGYISSLDSMEIFGVEGSFQTGGSPFVHPHNDFVYLFVELGAIGLGLLVVFWLSLFRKIRSLSRRGMPVTRYGVRVLVPVSITMFVVHLFDNGFAIRAVATRFFIAAGLVFGLGYLEWKRERLGVDPRSLRTTRGSALPDG